MKHSYIFFLLTFFISFSSIGNGSEGLRLPTHSIYTSVPNPKISDRDFKEMFLDAQDLFNYEYYNDALFFFKKLLAVDFNNSNLNFYVGVCILNSKQQRTKAIDYLKKAILKTDIAYSYNYKETSAPVFAYLYLGEAYHLNGQYDEALVSFTKFKSYLTNKNKDGDFLEEVAHCIEMTELAQKLIAKPIKATIVPFKAVNSIYSDLSIVASPDGTKFYFSSKRKGAMGGQKDVFGEYMDDIYYTQFKDNKWIKPKKMGSKMNSVNSDVLNCISPDGKQIYFSRMVRGTYEIFVSTLSKKNKWQTPQKLGININSKDNDLWAYITSDGNTMLFSSDRQGGYGGYDIYMSEKLSTGEWGKPFNLGSEVNTAFDEICPVLMPDGTLYFSSNGKNTMGGFDMFETVISENGLWAVPENMGYPLNTAFDDFNFTPLTPDGKKGYYTSAKTGGYGETDIYQFTIE
jgi:tetratricopeptide (TPR) repeat protein